MSIDVTYTFVAMTIARASEVNQNFTDLRDSIRGAHHQDADGTKLVNADLDGAAAVAYSKLALSDSIVNADINTSAAIAWSKINKSGSVLNDVGDVVITGAATQDILHRNGSSQWVNLAKGSNGDVLSMVAGLLTWQAPSFAHNDASGLQGGTAAQYYHLTSAQHTNVTSTLLGGTSTIADTLHRHSLLNDAEVVATDDILASADTERSNTVADTSWSLVKEITVGLPGQYRFTWEMKSSGGWATVNSRVYRNGSPVGTTKSTTSTSYVAQTDDVSGWSTGDSAQLYIQDSDTHENTFIQLFKVKAAFVPSTAVVTD